ncbi:hypothetical protein EZS27_027945 [termite gut metagenome]|uniref:Uncharacterized protein n=1 Tax=termite gut metagenome TaxID=433724 RepID=A0A5J4QLV3_9ZZZZ
MRKFVIFFLGTIILLFSCKREIPEDPSDSPVVDSIPPAKVHTINVYIENSGSMDGYVNGNTEFKDAIRDLLVELKYHYDAGKIKIHFINSDIHPTAIKIDLADFARNINTGWNVGNRASSNLNNVFKQILGKTGENTISILFSDCIYSINGEKTIDLLSDEKSLTKNAFLSKSKTDSIGLSTTIVKMKSRFTGTYYDKNNAKTYLTNENRPYYISVIGDKNAIMDFNSKIRVEKLQGFDNRYVMSSGSADKLYFSVLLSSYNEGRFKAVRNLSTKNYIHGIEDVKLNRRTNKPFTFAVAIDMKIVPVGADYLLNPSNYLFEDNNFKVKQIVAVDKSQINPSDWLRISSGNPTHIIIVEATGKAISNVSIALKKQIPQWVYDTNTEDDTNIRNDLDKTFGVKYLIEGISEAYQIIYPKDKNYFECNISIKQ